MKRGLQADVHDFKLENGREVISDQTCHGYGTDSKLWSKVAFWVISASYTGKTKYLKN